MLDTLKSQEVGKDPIKAETAWRVTGIFEITVLDSTLRR